MKIRYLRENTSQITDETILSLCYDEGRIKPLVYKWLEEKPSFKPIRDYLDTRYNDIPPEMFSYKEVLFRIKRGIETRPTCEICGAPVVFVGKTCGGTFPTYYHATCCKEHERLLAKQSEKKTLNDRYGVDYTFQLPEIKKKSLANRNSPHATEKRKKTMKDRYGYEYAFRNPESVKVAKANSAKYKTMMSQKYREMQEILLNDPSKTIDDYRGISEYEELVRYYDEMTNILNKTYLTQKENGTASSSMPEEKLYDILSSNFDNVERNYKEERYNHRCDFYIPNLDLFIEYQGSMFHGGRPYDQDDEICQEHLQYLMGKADARRNITGTKFTRYDSEIAVWTYGDVQKRDEAIKNKLNYLEIYPNINLDDIPDIINTNYNENTKGKHIIIGTK